MGDNEEVRSDVNQRLQSSFGTSSSTVKQSSFVKDQLAIPPINQSQFRSRHNFSGDRESSSKRVGIPPISPYSQIPTSRAINQQMGSQNYSHGPTHSRSLSQSSFFSLDSLPPLSPSPFGETPSTSISDQVSPDVSMEDRDANSQSLLPSSSFNKRSENLPPRKAHRRSISDIPFGLSSLTHQQQQAFPHFLPLSGSNSWELEGAISGSENSKATKALQLVKREFGWERGGGDNNVEGIRDRKSQGEVVDDLFSAYMNLDGIDALNYSGIDDNKNGNENHEDLDSRASGTKTNEGDSSENEADSSMNENGRLVQKMELRSLTEKREGIKRRAGGDVAVSGRHHRSVSMDSFMGKLHFGDESPKLPPSPGTCSGQLSPNNSIDDNSNAFGMEFGNGEFNGTELKKIMTNEKLAEIALADPKRAKRILANRQSAARSKERKMMYISELEHKVQTLQTEATTLSAQLTLLQRDSIGLTNQNNELKFRLQAMQQQAQLRDALNEALTAEVQRLKLATAEFSGESHPSKCMASQFSANPHVFLSQQQPQQQNCGTTAKSKLN